MPRPKRQSRTPARLSETEAEQPSAKRRRNYKGPNRRSTGRPIANASTLPVYNVSVASNSTLARPSTASDVRPIIARPHVSDADAGIHTVAVSQVASPPGESNVNFGSSNVRSCNVPVGGIYTSSNIGFAPQVGLGSLRPTCNSTVSALSPTFSSPPMAMPTVSMGLNSMQSHPLPFGIANSGFGAEPPVGLVSTSVAMGAQPIMQAYGDFPMSRPVALQQASASAQLGMHVPQNIKDKIWAGAFIDLSLLYQDNAKAILSKEMGGAELTLAVDGDRMVIKQGVTHSKKVDTFDKWCSAFHTFMAIYLTKHPGRAIEMLKYIETIRLAAIQFAGAGWKKYDEQFRLQQESNPSNSWGVINMELWVTVAAATAALPAHFSPSASQPSFGQGARGFCYAYNGPNGCHYRSCKFQHKCSKCFRMGHNAASCRVGGGFAKQRPTFTPARKNNLPQSVRFGKPVVHSPKPALDAQVKSGNSAQHAFRTSNTN